MTSTFDGNPAVWFTIGKVGNTERRKRALAAFLYDYCAMRDGVFLSADGSGVLLAYISNAHGTWFKSLMVEINLALRVIGIFRIARVLKRSQRIRAAQKQHGPHIHCWYIGVLKESRHNQTARELQHKLFALSDQLKLPVLAETTIARNRKAYEFIGFTIYQSVTIGSITTWLLVRHPVE